MPKTTSSLIANTINQLSTVHMTLDRFVKKGSNIIWGDINQVLNYLNEAEPSVEKLISEFRKPKRRIKESIIQEFGGSVDLEILLPILSEKRQELIAEALSLFNNNNTREVLQEDGETIFQEAIFKSPAIDPLIAKAIEIRELLRDFA